MDNECNCHCLQGQFQGLLNCFVDGVDLVTFKCKWDSFKVPKQWLCSKSDVITNLFDDQWKDKNVIRIPDQRFQTFKMFVKLLFKMCPISDCSKNDLQKDSRMCDEYQCHELRMDIQRWTILNLWFINQDTCIDMLIDDQISDIINHDSRMMSNN